jgi:hypothetical protein
MLGNMKRGPHQRSDIREVSLNSRMSLIPATHAHFRKL